MKIKLLISALLIITLGFTTKAQYTKLLDFNNSVNGSNPNGSLISDGTYLYGMTFSGGTSAGTGGCVGGSCGTVFKIKPDGTGYTDLLNFNGTNGSNPNGSLISDGTFLYGMTSFGGTGNCPYGCGTIFKIKTDGTGYFKLYDFSHAHGIMPYGSLITDGTYLYGMTAGGGGIDSVGTIFKIKTDGTGFVNLMNFNSVNGGGAFGSLISDGTYLYGMTSTADTITSAGAIFKIKTDGTAYTNLMNFNGVNGSEPYGSLISDGTYLYGMTSAGGIYSNGNIFKIKTDGTGYYNLLDFDPIPNGATPHGDLVSDGTYLYGMTSVNGAIGGGTIFKIMHDGTGLFADLYDFDNAGTNGGSPFGSLIFVGSCLYGMTNDAGTYGYGTLFRYCLATGITENNPETNFTIYPNPTNGVFNLKMNELQNPEIKELKVLNVLSECVYHLTNEQMSTSSTMQIDLSSEPNGIYFISLQTEKGAAIKKIIIQK